MAQAAAKTKTDRSAEGRSTAAPDELARFAALADSWWDPDGKFRPLHRLNPTRIAFIRDRVSERLDRDPLAPNPLAGLDVLDIGCGGGLLAEPMRRLGATVTGIDAGAEAIEVARLHAAEAGLDIDYACAPPEDLVAAGRTFDVVLNMEVVEHVADLDAFLAASAALLRPGGAMTVATLNRTLRALALAKIGAEYVMRWLPVGTHDWRKFVRPSELTRGLARHGVEVAEITGVAYDPLTGDWRLSRDLDINYMAFATKA
jgi:2-polyprenyl-6-hydroxyphenyl methylase/3-demethylubiquinone-9 3-methyltransferase